MKPGLLVFFGLYGLFLLFAFIFIARRLLWRVRRKGFRPSGVGFGDAMQRLQVFAQPEVRWVVEKKDANPEEDAHDGDPPTTSGR